MWKKLGLFLLLVQWIEIALVPMGFLMILEVPLAPAWAFGIVVVTVLAMLLWLLASMLAES